MKQGNQKPVHTISYGIRRYIFANFLYMVIIFLLVFTVLCAHIVVNTAETRQVVIARTVATSFEKHIFRALEALHYLAIHYITKDLCTKEVVKNGEIYQNLFYRICIVNTSGKYENLYPSDEDPAAVRIHPFFERLRYRKNIFNIGYFHISGPFYSVHTGSV